MATLCVDKLLGKPPGSPQALRHLQNTYRCFNRELKEAFQPSDPTIAVVVSLAVHENLTSEFGIAKLHLDALERILDLRGGIEGFASNSMLWHKVCRYGPA